MCLFKLLLAVNALLHRLHMKFLFQEFLLFLFTLLNILMSLTYVERESVTLLLILQNKKELV